MAIEIHISFEYTKIHFLLLFMNKLIFAWCHYIKLENGFFVTFFCLLVNRITHKLLSLSFVTMVLMLIHRNLKKIYLFCYPKFVQLNGNFGLEMEISTENSSKSQKFWWRSWENVFYGQVQQWWSEYR